MTGIGLFCRRIQAPRVPRHISRRIWAEFVGSEGWFPAGGLRGDDGAVSLLERRTVRRGGLEAVTRGGSNAPARKSGITTRTERARGLASARERVPDREKPRY